METKQADRIRTCIDHYMEGESSQEELRLLKRYFDGSNEIPDDLQPFREMFELLDKKQVQPSANAIGRLTRIGITRQRMHLWPWIAAACAIALILVLTTPPKNVPATLPQLAVTAHSDIIQSNTSDDSISDTNIIQKTLHPVQQTVQQKTMAAVSNNNSQAAEEPKVQETETGYETYLQKLCSNIAIDTTGIGQKLMALEQEFHRQDSIYILSLIAIDKEATLAANSIYVSLLE